MRSWLWILVIAIPILATLQVVGTIRSIDATHAVTAPRYVEATESALSQLDSKALSKLSASLLNDHKKMAEWWRWAGNTYETTTYILLGLVFMLAAILAIVLWRMPSNPALESGRAKSGATAQRKR